MKPLMIPILLMTALFACGPAVASEAAVKKLPKKSQLPVGSPAMDKRVGEAQTIFVGEAVRIYFVDRRYQEAPYIRAAGEGASKAAMILVKVTKVLHPAKAEIPGRVLIPIETSKGDIFSDGRSPYDEQVQRHVGKPGIWFGNIIVRNDYGDDKSGRRPLEDPVTLLQSWDSRKRPTVNSLPIAQLKEVENSISRVKLAKAPPREEKAEAAVAKSENDDKALNNK